MDTADEYPSCFSSKRQYATWQASALLTGVTERNGYCTDCLPEFKRDRLREGRCAHPDVTFHVDEDGFIEGRRPLIKKGAQNEIIG